MRLDLEQLIRCEAAYAGVFANVHLTETAWFVECPRIPDLWDGNRALHLRDDGRGPETVALEVIERLRRRTARPVADLDDVAEAQGIGDALRRHGMRAMDGDWMIMRFAAAAHVLGDVADTGARAGLAAGSEIGSEWVEVCEVGRAMERAKVGVLSDGAAGRAEWVDTAVTDNDNDADRGMWREVAIRETLHPDCRCYIGRLDGRPAGVCMLLSAGGWGRIEEVATRPEFRRRGVASAVVRRAVFDSLEMGNEVTYLFTEPGGQGERVYLKLGFEPWAVNPMRRCRA